MKGKEKVIKRDSLRKGTKHLLNNYYNSWRDQRGVEQWKKVMNTKQKSSDSNFSSWRWIFQKQSSQDRIIRLFDANAHSHALVMNVHRGVRQKASRRKYQQILYEIELHEALQGARARLYLMPCLELLSHVTVLVLSSLAIISLERTSTTSSSGKSDRSQKERWMYGNATLRAYAFAK